MKNYKKEAIIYFMTSWILLFLLCATIILSSFGVIKW